MEYQRMVGFGEAIKRAFSNYCNFNGRASRSEYWWFQLFCFLITLPLTIGHVVMSMNTASGDIDMMDYTYDDLGFSMLSTGFFSINVFTILLMIVSLAFLLPSLGLIWRRLHDTGKGGGWFFISFVPYVGQLILLVMLCMAGQPTANRFGPVPNLVPSKAPADAPFARP